ncbi:pilus assembly protein [Cellulophaga sp. F20128]|uniref:pilus assembly protein n=1 Tax=Cellulophaga sp. F20128 TaxID=2926413 RepID=UPI001FF573D1|nr:pilus assembly protein [Cellulophaga sp. F20128]MCK0156579.1 pilus assembly protein [Cellulophaga sp. F20128]
MKRKFINFKTLATFTLFVGLITSCTNDDTDGGEPEPGPIENSRWITVTGARMGTNPGDGNGGTLLYAISNEDAKNQETVVDVFNNGFVAPSNRTARLQSSEDGNTMFNISYAGDTGGNYTKYTVEGGQNYTPTGSEVSIAPYVGTAPRWIKLFDGDQTGAAVYVSTEHEIDNNGTPDDVSDDTYLRTEATIGIVTLDLVNSSIKNFQEHSVPLSAEEEAEGYYFSRIDMPTLNAAGDKLYIGGRLSKVDPTTVESESGYEILGSKTIVLDYPSLLNPTVITSTVGHGNTNGYRSINSFEYNGSVYQANQSDPEGSHILKIDTNNEYDNSYVFSLDNALGVNDAYIVAWRPASNGKAVVAYEHAASATGPAGKTQGFFAMVDLNAKTATKLDEIPSTEDLYLFQYQGFAVYENEVYLTVAPIGQDGNIYVVDTETGAVTKGAQLKNAEGSHFIGTF